jgi:hypothetical protein
VEEFGGDRVVLVARRRGEPLLRLVERDEKDFGARFLQPDYAFPGVGFGRFRPTADGGKDLPALVSTMSGERPGRIG